MDYDSICITSEDHWVALIPIEDSGLLGIANDYLGILGFCIW